MALDQAGFLDYRCEGKLIELSDLLCLYCSYLLAATRTQRLDYGSCLLQTPRSTSCHPL